MAGVAQLVGALSPDQRVAGSIPDQGVWDVWDNQQIYFFHIDLPLPFSFSLKELKKMPSGEDKKTIIIN